jgi:hypothetical protein
MSPTNGYLHIAACTGNASEDTMRRVYGLPEIALIEMGDFVGAVLKHLRKVPVDKLSLCGGFGKISKLAAGHMDLHSRHSSIDLPQLAEWAAAIGADAALQQSIAKPTPVSKRSPWPARPASPSAMRSAAMRWTFARSVVPAQVQVEVFAIDRQGGIVGHAEPCNEAHPAAGRRHRGPGHRPHLGPQHIYSLAGIGRVPTDLTCQVRVGGYGGAEGLAQFMRDEGIDLLLDATHPYAAQISHNAAPPRAERHPAGRCAARPGSHSPGMTGAKSATGPN